MRNKIDEYFYQPDKVSFIDLQSGGYIGLDVNISYPIETDTIIEGVKDASFKDEISYKHIIDGIILTLAIDPDFEYKDTYLKTLEKVLGDIQNYVLTKGQDLLKKDANRAIYYFRFLHLTKLGNSFSEYLYARLLYLLYEEKGEDYFRKEAIWILEGLISKDEDFPLSYYELGIINTKDEMYNKAYLYFEKAFERVEDNLVREELREYMRDIYPHALLERGVERLYKSDLQGALKEFEEARSLADNAAVNYYLGVVTEAMGDVEGAIEYYESSLDKHGNFRELYQDLAIAYYKVEDPLSGLEVLNKGLEVHYEDANLLYNRMVIYVSLDRIDLAKKDMETILQYGDVSDEILQNIQIIKQEYGI